MTGPNAFYSPMRPKKSKNTLLHFQSCRFNKHRKSQVAKFT